MRRLIVAGLALALVAGACGGAASKSGTAEREPKVATARLVSSAADAAARQQSARISGEVGFSMGGKQMSVPIEGAIDFRNQAVQMTMSMAGLTGGQTAGDVEIRMVDGVMYMNMGSLLGERGASMLNGKQWLSVDANQAGGQDGTQNPADLLGSLRGAGDVELVGHGELDGVEVDHYRAEIDLAEAVAQLPADQRRQAEAGLKMLGTSFPVDVWIDADGLPRRIAVDIDAGGAHVTERIDFTDWGTDVTVTPPPADQVQSMQDFTRATGGAGTLGA